MALTKLNNQSLSAVTSAGLPSGTVLQVKQTILSTAWSSNSTTWDNTPLVVSITPSSLSNKILVNVNAWYATQFWNNNPYIRLVRDSTTISFNDSYRHPRPQYDSTRDANQGYPVLMNILDTPATTSSVTYALQVKSGSGSYYMRLNRQDSDSTAWAQSMITVTEIAG